MQIFFDQDLVQFHSVANQLYQDGYLDILDDSLRRIISKRVMDEDKVGDKDVEKFIAIATTAGRLAISGRFSNFISVMSQFNSFIVGIKGTSFEGNKLASDQVQDILNAKIFRPFEVKPEGWPIPEGIFVRDVIKCALNNSQKDFSDAAKLLVETLNKRFGIKIRADIPATGVTSPRSSGASNSGICTIL